jgi:hypothetical protein
MTINKTLFGELGFAEAIEVATRVSIADVFQPDHRCGIYILHFANGEYYAGLAVSVARRFTQHRKTYTDITRLSFKEVAVENLRREERRVISALERSGFHLRNIEHTSETYAPSVFDDEIFSSTERESWLQTISWQEVAGERLNNPLLRRKYTHRFNEFIQLPYAENVIGIVRDYVWRCIPAPFKTEQYFWSCSLPLESRPDGLLIYLRVSINGQEVFTIGTEKEQIFFTWHVAKSVLNKPLWGVKRFEHRYHSGGRDQTSIEVKGFKRARRLLNEPQYIHSMRIFNLRLMRKGPTRFYRYHVFMLADRLVENAKS